MDAIKSATAGGRITHPIWTVVRSDIAIQFQHIFLDCKNTNDLYPEKKNGVARALETHAVTMLHCYPYISVANVFLFS
jgi:hypothetical protein